MGEGVSVSTAQGINDAILRQVPFVVPAIWAKVHLGAPEGDGTANPCVEVTRVDVSACFGAPDDTVISTNIAPLGPWPTGTKDENPTHISFHTEDDPGGTFVVSGLIDGLDDDETVPIGGCTLVWLVAS